LTKTQHKSTTIELDKTVQIAFVPKVINNCVTLLGPFSTMKETFSQFLQCRKKQSGLSFSSHERTTRNQKHYLEGNAILEGEVSYRFGA